MAETTPKVAEPPLQEVVKEKDDDNSDDEPKPVEPSSKLMEFISEQIVKSKKAMEEEQAMLNTPSPVKEKLVPKKKEEKKKEEKKEVKKEEKKEEKKEKKEKVPKKPLETPQPSTIDLTPLATTVGNLTIQEIIAIAANARKPVQLTSADEDSDNEEKEASFVAKKKAIPKHVKTLVWNKYIGSDKAKAPCMSCRQEEIVIRSFHCGRVISEAKGGDMTINNLRPICAACNGSMGTMSMNDFTTQFFGWQI